MKEWLVDTNVLLDVLGADPHFGERSKAALVACATTGVLIINPVIFAEVGVMIDSLEELNVLLPETLFRRDLLPWEAAFLAGRAFRRYKQAGGGKRRMLADFLIGAHAAVAGFTLLSRDRSYLHYFDIEVLDPSGAE